MDNRFVRLSMKRIVVKSVSYQVADLAPYYIQCLQCGTVR